MSTQASTSILADAAPAPTSPNSVSSYGGGGNGITGSRQVASSFDVLAEGSANISIANLTEGGKWGGTNIGSGVALTYSFGTDLSAFNYTEAASEKTPLLAAQMTAAVSAMNAMAAVANVTFSEITDSAGAAGDIRWNNTTSTSVGTAYAYYPGSGIGGDIWFGPHYDDYRNPVVGGYGYYTFMHELGHALGLNHPHQSVVTAKPGEDSQQYSIMSYTFYGKYATTPMLNDIQALQWLYGANTTYHTGDDTYSWAAGTVVYQTIWDAGGNDTISAATQTAAVSLYLTSGKYSQIGATYNSVRDTLAIAYGATIENAIGSAFNDTIEGNQVANMLDGGAGSDNISGGEGNDTLIGGLGNDNLIGGTGNDALTGSAGMDAMDGGAGGDTVNYDGAFADYAFGYSKGVITIEDKNVSNGNEGIDVASNVEVLHFADKNLTMVDGLRYIASYGDLINAYKANADAGVSHYLRFGFAEGRQASFDAQVYINKYADVRALAGTDLNMATMHYVETGFGAGRSVSLTSADNLTDTAGNDNILAYGGNDSISIAAGNDTIDGGTGIDTVSFSGNFADYAFAWGVGTITIEDKNLTNGNDGIDHVSNAEVLHFVDKNLTLVDGLRYIASYGDLINAYHADADAGISHYLRFGFAEGRSASFDAQVYIDKYADVRALVGTDQTKATQHFIDTGFALGRSASLTSADNLTGTAGSEVIKAYGGNDTIAGAGGDDFIDGGAGSDTVNFAGNFADYGFAVDHEYISVEDKNLSNGNEGRDSLSNVEVLHFADRDVTVINGLRYIASYADLINAYHANIDAGLSHYLRFGLIEGRQVSFDAEVYLNKYADVRLLAGNSLDAATTHYLNTGFAAGRNASLTSADNLTGTAANDTILAFGGNDSADGGSGNDTIDGGSGSDVLDGSVGTDTANYSGNFADYGFAMSGGVITIEDKNLANGNDGTDTLRNFEKLHFANKDVSIVDGLRYIASYGDLINAYHTNSDAGLSHYLRYGVTEGRYVRFDPAAYLAKYADVRNAYGDDLVAATRHYINYGYAEGRTAAQLPPPAPEPTTDHHVALIGSSGTVNEDTLFF